MFLQFLRRYLVPPNENDKTLLQITGAVTSYIIILIQFNLAYQRTKNSTTGNSTISNTTNASLT